jgi:hypothetical protein
MFIEKLCAECVDKEYVYHVATLCATLITLHMKSVSVEISLRVIFISVHMVKYVAQISLLCCHITFSVKIGY